MPDSNHFDEDVMKSFERDRWLVPVVAYSALAFVIGFVIWGLFIQS